MGALNRMTSAYLLAIGRISGPGSDKGSKDPAYTNKTAVGGAVRRKVFFPFASGPHVIVLHVVLGHADFEKLCSADIVLTFGPAPIAEEIETLKDVYGIEERYRGKLLSGDGKAWVVEVG
jgi:hypothetical protein